MVLDQIRKASLVIMSNVSDRHSIVPFVAGKTEALTGQRLCKVGYKSTAKTPALFPSVAVSVPPMAVDTEAPEFAALVPHINVWLESVQDKIVRSLYETSDGALTSVGDSEINLAQCIAYLNAESNGGRLTKDAVTAWFDSDCREILTALLAEKLGFADTLTDAQLKVIAQKVAAYREVIGSLSGGATVLQPAQIKSVRTLFGMCDSSAMLDRLNARLDSMEKPKEKIEELLEL